MTPVTSQCFEVLFIMVRYAKYPCCSSEIKESMQKTKALVLHFFIMQLELNGRR